MMIDECITKAANMSGDDSRTRSRYTIAVYGGGKLSAAGNAVYELKLSRTRKTTDNVVELGTRSSYFPRLAACFCLAASLIGWFWRLDRFASWRHRVSCLLLQKKTFASHNSRPPAFRLEFFLHTRADPKTLLTQKSLNTASESGAKT